MDMSHQQDIAELLSQCRTAMMAGEENVGNALSVLVQAIRLSRGDHMIIETLQSARREFMADVDRGKKSTQHRSQLNAAIAALNHMLDQPSILYDLERSDILVDAFQDGSSIICARCGALVPRERSLQHANFWCEANDDLTLEDCGDMEEDIE